jgi:cation transport ATPase
MVNPIPGGTAFDFGAAAQAVGEQSPTTTTSVALVKQPAGVEPVADTVKLSAGAQVRLLKTQGQTVPQIAVDTALSAQTVDSYLGITQAPPAPVAASSK